MIVFCEDCGQKNDVLPETVGDTKKIEYRCSACNYLNKLIMSVAQDCEKIAASRIIPGDSIGERKNITGR